jgi:hypothetical protein
MTYVHSIRGAGRAARLLSLVAVALGVCTAAARAEVTTLDGTVAPIVRVMIQEGDVTIRTWDRPTVAVDGDPSLTIERKTVRTGEAVPPITIPYAKRGGAAGIAQLPAESFVVSSIAPGPHDQIVVRDRSGAIGNVTVTVPASTQMVFARTVRGDLTVANYHGGTFIGFVGQGRLAIEDFNGDAFAQVGLGSLVATDSIFSRVRTRVLYANAIFERCRSRQIESTSVVGSVVYDNGTFDEGLARFDASSGDVAIGTAGAAELNGHVAADGRLYTLFDRGAHVDNRNGDATAIVGSGGPSVNATSASGNIYLYDGTLRTRTNLPTPWRDPQTVLFRDPFREIQLERQRQQQPRRAQPQVQRRFLREVRVR